MCRASGSWARRETTKEGRKSGGRRDRAGGDWIELEGGRERGESSCLGLRVVLTLWSREPSRGWAYSFYIHSFPLWVPTPTVP